MAKQKDKREKTLRYKVISMRLDDNLIEWLKNENIKYKSWNRFFKVIKIKYDLSRNEN